MRQTDTRIINRRGLHARAAAKFAGLAARFASSVELVIGNEAVNGKSIMSVMMLTATLGTQLILRVDGEDEDDATEQLLTLINNRFDEHE